MRAANHIPKKATADPRGCLSPHSLKLHFKLFAVAGFVISITPNCCCVRSFNHLLLIFFSALLQVNKTTLDHQARAFELGKQIFFFKICDM